MNPNGKTPCELAVALRAGIESKDVDAVMELYHEDAIVWRNFDDRSLHRRQFQKVVQYLADQVENLRYDEVQVAETPLGFVQQHRLRGTTPSGAELDVAACLVATCREGLIVRLDEYLDSAQLAPLMGERG